MTKQPNIILILNDDMGFSDLGCYGGEVNTPNLDALAAQGLRFTQFYNTARCSPSRASLLTGLHPHQCGIGVLTQDDGPEGYAGNLNNCCVTMAEVLGKNGYRTYMSGKWHMAHDFTHVSDAWPNQRGFQEHYGTIGGAGSYFHPNTLTRNNVNIDDEAAQDPSFYYTDVISDQAAGFVRNHLDEHGDEPYFLYTAFTAPHWPLHAREEDILANKGNYDAGWDTLRQRRVDRMQKMGILKYEWKLSRRDPAQPPWQDAEHKEWQARRMEVYAAQIESMDRGIGRIIQAVRDTGEERNTIIIFLADNGGCAEEIGSEWKDFMVSEPIARDKTRDGTPVRFGNSPDILPGSEDTYTSYGVPWANLSNAPFRYYKHWIHEGGIATPFIISWLEGLKIPPGSLHHQPAQLPDVMATILDITGIEYPRRYNGNDIHPLEGESFLPVLNDSDYARGMLFWEHEGNAAVRDGAWKLVRNFTAAESATPGYDPQDRRGGWELYNMESDRSELHDLAADYPELVARLETAYKLWARRCGVIDREKVLNIRRTRVDPSQRRPSKDDH